MANLSGQVTHRLKFGFPTRFRHHLVKEFENNLPYDPQGNGQVAWFNHTLLSMLHTLEDKEKEDWKVSLAKGQLQKE